MPEVLLVPLVICLLLNSPVVRAVIQEMGDLSSLSLSIHHLIAAKSVTSLGTGYATVLKKCAPKRISLQFFTWWKALIFPLLGNKTFLMKYFCFEEK